MSGNMSKAIEKKKKRKKEREREACRRTHQSHIHEFVVSNDLDGHFFVDDLDIASSNNVTKDALSGKAKDLESPIQHLSNLNLCKQNER